MLKIGFNFGTDVIALPGSVREHLADASAEDMRFLISAASAGEFEPKKLAKELGMTEAALRSCVSFWRGAGVIFEVGGTGSAGVKVKKANVEDVPKKHIVRDDSLPRYTTTELTAAIGKVDRGALLEYCQQAMGRVFNEAEAEILMGLCDYMNLTPDYVALLCDHLTQEKKGRMSLRILENTAKELYDRNIVETDALISYFEIREKAYSLRGKVRTLFGLGSRSFTPSEERMLEKWAGALPEEGMLEYAYELTVNATGEAPLKYTDAIIDKWIAGGFNTLAEVKAKEEEFQKTKAPRQKKNVKAAEPSVSSFSTDDFFEAALKRSYESGTEDGK